MWELSRCLSEMAMVSHGLPLRAPSRFTPAADALVSTSCPPYFLGCRLQQWRNPARMSGELSKISVGRQSHHGRICRFPGHDWQPQKESIKGYRRQQSKLVTGALPTVVSAAATVLAVGGAIFALTRLNKDATPTLQTKKECEVCGGSGVCPTCRGEGFVNKNLSAEAAAKARATAKDAATRYTAGLAKKWNYCTTCAGQRGCQACEGRGWVA